MRMNFLKNKTIIGQIITMIALIPIIICSIFIFIFVRQMEKEFDHFHRNDVLRTASILKSAIEISENSKKTVERLIDEKLHLISKEIAKELRGKTIEEVTQQDLIALRNKYDVYNISLLVRRNDDIIIAQSSDPNEIGLSTKEWGYWYDAFQQLMSGKPVTVGKGYYQEHYWVGPISKSDWENKYFKYAYYYDGTTEFMINPYILDSEIYHATKHSDPEALIHSILKFKESEIEEIAVINANVLLRSENRDIIEPERDAPILYGKNSYKHEKDHFYIQKVLKENQMESVKLGENYRKYYLPIPNDRVITIVTDLSAGTKFFHNIIFLFVLSFVAAFVIIFFVLQVITKKYLTPIPTIHRYINKIAAGDLTEEIHVDQKNEFGDIAAHLNEMTDRISQLIVDIKNDIETLRLVSNVLSETVHSYFHVMDEVSTTMTKESREIFHEIELEVKEIRQNYENINQQLEKLKEANHFEFHHVSNFIIQSSHQLIRLNDLMKQNVKKVTEMNLSSFDAIQQLNEIIIQLDNLSKDLENKINKFKVQES